MERKPTLVERLERIVSLIDEGHAVKLSEDYRAIEYACKQIDYMNRPKVTGMKTQSEKLRDVEDMPENTVNEKLCPGCGRPASVCAAEDIYDPYIDLREPMA